MKISGTVLPWILLLSLVACSDISDAEEGVKILETTVVVNPTGLAPLSAHINIAASRQVNVRMTVEGKDGPESDLIQDFRFDDAHFVIPVHGLYADTNNTIHLTYLNDSDNELATETLRIRTDALIAKLPSISINKASRGAMEPGMTLVNYFGHNGKHLPTTPFVFDSFGKIRWYLDFRGSSVLNRLFYDDGVHRLQNGNIYFGDTTSNKIYELDMFGQIVNIFNIPGYKFHHEVLEKPDGNLLVAATGIGEFTVEDYILELDRSSKEIITIWDLKKSLNQHRKTLTRDASDWMHINAVNYDQNDDTIIVSGRTQGVVKLTRDNQVVWILGPRRDWGVSGEGLDLNAYLLQPLDSAGQPILEAGVLSGVQNHPDFEWNWYQHSPSFMSNGNIILFDNGDNRNFNGNGRKSYSRAVEFKVDTVNKTVQQVWQYGKERESEMFSRIVSDVDYLPLTNHVLVSPGALIGPLHGKSIEVDYTTKEIIFEATIIPPMGYRNLVTFHRTERISLYP